MNSGGFQDDGIYAGSSRGIQRDELWIYDSPVVQLRTYSTGEPVQKYDPYQWSYSPYLISNQVSIQPQASMVAISHKTKVRLG